MTEIDWYFDFISPYAYLQFFHMDRLPGDVTVRFRPVLFAGLLNQWGHKGPAEIPSKRVFIFRQALWLARQENIPFQMPPTHPFNPLRALRLAIALGSSRDSIGKIFTAIWSDRLVPDNPEGWRGIMDAVGCGDGDRLVGSEEVKNELRENGERAIAQGVFGVPTFCTDGELFWGQDATGMMLDYLRDPALFADSEYQRINTTVPSAVRPEHQF